VVVVMVFATTERRSEQVSSAKGRACHEKRFSVRRATATGIKRLKDSAEYDISSGTNQQGWLVWADLYEASQREGQMQQRKLADTPKSVKGTHRHFGHMPARVPDMPTPIIIQ